MGHCHIRPVGFTNHAIHVWFTNPIFHVRVFLPLLRPMISPELRWTIKVVKVVVTTVVRVVGDLLAQFASMPYYILIVNFSFASIW